jgi:hypothetical protein
VKWKSVLWLLALTFLGVGNLQASNWTLMKQSQGVEFYYRVENCGGQDMVFIKVDNNNAHDVITDFSFEVLSNGEVVGGSPVLLQIASNAVHETGCANGLSSEFIPQPIGDFTNPQYNIEIFNVKRQ